MNLKKKKSRKLLVVFVKFIKLLSSYSWRLTVDARGIHGVTMSLKFINILGNWFQHFHLTMIPINYSCSKCVPQSSGHAPCPGDTKSESKCTVGV